MSALAPAYRPRRPTETALYRVVREHLETFLAHTRETYDAPLPRYVEEELAQPLDACAAIAMQRGSMRALPDDERAPEQEDVAPPEPPRDHGAVEHHGFNLHASVAIAAGDDLGRERLRRYGARPPLALGRLRRLPDGRIAYRIKSLRGGRSKHRVMTPLEFLARLAALVPPPRYPLVRFHGVLAPRSSWRRDVVPPARVHVRPAAPTQACRAASLGPDHEAGSGASSF